MVKKWLKTIFVFFSSFLCCQRNNREESDILWEFDPHFFLFSFLSSFRLWFSLPFVCFLWTKFDAKSFFVAFSNLVRIFDWSYLISIGMKLIEHKFKMKKKNALNNENRHHHSLHASCASNRWCIDNVVCQPFTLNNFQFAHNKWYLNLKHCYF